MRHQNDGWDDLDCITSKEYLCEVGEKATTTPATTQAPSPACSCGTGWLGNIDTGKCYKGSNTTKAAYAAADTVCKVRESTSCNIESLILPVLTDP